MKKLLVLTVIASLSGCASHANIQMPGVNHSQHTAFEKKSVSLELLYSQPKPGIFNGNEKMPLVPFEQAEFSVSSANTLKDLPQTIFKQLPATTTRALNEHSDLKLIIELTAHDKKGPAYADFEFAKSLGKSFLTLGLGSSEYNLIADFNAKYKLYKGENEVFEKQYTIDDSVDHEKAQFEGNSTTNELVSQLLEKHLMITLNDFFNESAKKI